MNDAVCSPGQTLRREPPSLATEETALFLDLDGTLLELAATPKAVVVPPDLAADLAAASRALGGALAIVSGRTLAEIDQFLTPLQLPAGAEHGAIIRLPDGGRDDLDASVPEDWIARLRMLQDQHPGVLIEPKAHGVAAHFRSAPQAEEEVGQVAAACVDEDQERFELLAGKMVFEIRPRSARKGRAVHRFMERPPFRGRKPVFVGDDVTDEDGFAAAQKLGGLGLHVAQVFDGEPRSVRRWLKHIAQS